MELFAGGAAIILLMCLVACVVSTLVEADEPQAPQGERRPRLETQLYWGSE